MEDIIKKVNDAYQKGISDKRFQKAINSMIKESEKGQAKNQIKNDIKEKDNEMSL